MKNLKVIFMGTPDFSVPVLETLIKNCNVIGVVTQPDKEVGRKKEIKFSPIKEVALNNGIKVIQPIKIKNEHDEINCLVGKVAHYCFIAYFAHSLAPSKL